MKIQDGKGSGKLAEVDGRFRLKVASEASDSAFISNQNGVAFIYATPIFSITAATEHRLAYISNDENSNLLIIDLERITFDGGSTSNTKPGIFRCYLNSSAPSANDTPKDPNGASTEASGKISTTFTVWDEVGAGGLTQSVAGDLLGESIFAIGSSDNSLPSKLILGPGKSLTYSFECAEACDVSMQVYTHIFEEG